MSTVISFPKTPTGNNNSQPPRLPSSVAKWFRALGYAALLPVRLCLQLFLFVASFATILLQGIMPYLSLFSFIATVVMWINEHNTSWHDPWTFWLPATVFTLSIPAWFLLERISIRLQEIAVTRKASYLKNPPEKVCVNL